MSSTLRRERRDTSRARKPGPSPQRLAWWIPQTVQAGSIVLAVSGAVPKRYRNPVMVSGLAAAAGITLLMETRLARRAREGRAGVVVLDGSGPRARHAAEVAELRRAVEALASRLDSQDEAWEAWHASHGCELGRPRLSVVDGTRL